MLRHLLAALAARQPPVMNLEFDADNDVCYLDDVSGPAREVASMSIVPYRGEIRCRTFKLNLGAGDIVPVNGKPAAGFYLRPWTQVLAATTLTPGRSTTDVAGSCPGIHTVTLLHPDGTPTDSIRMSGVAGHKGQNPGATHPSARTGSGVGGP